MKRFSRLLSALTATTLVEWVGRHVATAGSLMLLGVGGAVGIINLLTPTITPHAAAYFNQNQAFGNVASGLLPNGGTAGAFNVPTSATGSWAVTFDAEVNPRLGYGGVLEAMLGQTASGTGKGLILYGNNNSKPFFSYIDYSFASGVNTGSWWLATSALNGLASVSMVPGSNYNGGIYSGTATGGGCRVEPTIVVQGASPTNPGSPSVTNPGFDCTGWVGGVSSPAAVSDVSMAGFGARQSTLATTTCAVVTDVVNGVSTSRAVVTANVAVAHGLTPGMTYQMAGFTPSGYNTSATLYTALQGTSGATLVGNIAGVSTCPGAVTVEGTALSGTGESVTFPIVSTTNPWGAGGLGITTNNGRHICGVIVENGDDSAFPGAASIALVDDKGVALDGSPRLVQNLNQGAAFFNGYTVVGAQSPSTPALTVTSMIPFTISSASYNTGGSFPGSIAFAMASAMPVGFIPGSEFTVSGATPSSVNGSYVVLTGTSGTTVIGNPLSGPNGVLQPLSNPGAITFSSGQLVSVIMPGESVLGGTGFYNSDISPYGTFGSTGTGGVGTYGLILNQAPFTFTGSITQPGLLTAGNPGFQSLAPNENLTWTSPSGSATITQFTSGAGGSGTYQTNYTGPTFNGQTATNQLTINTGAPGSAFPNGTPITGAGLPAGLTITASASTSSYTLSATVGTVAAETMGAGIASQSITVTGAMGSSGSPVGMMAFPGYYYKIGSSSGAVATATTLTKYPQSGYGDVVSPIGASATTITPFATRGWGGSIANVGMLWGQFPMDAGGVPSATGLASLCKKTTTIPAYAAANNLTVHGLYELNDIGIFGDSSWADFHGHTAGSTLTIDSTEAGSLPAFSASYAIRFSGPGLPVGGVLATAGSAGGPYTLASSAGTIASEAMKAGAYAPATPIASTNFQGYVDSSSILHVTNFDTTAHTGFASFTGSLSSEWTGGIFAGTDNYTAQIFPGTGNYTANITATSMNVTAITGTPLKIGDPVNCTGCTAGTTIASFGTGAGGVGTYNITPSQTVGSSATFTNGATATQGLMVVSAITGTPLIVGDPVVCAACTPTTISALGTGTGGTGSYVLGATQTVASTAAMSNGGVAGTGILSITTAATPVAGIGTVVNPAPGQTSFTQFTINNLVTGTGQTGVYGFATAPGTQLGTGEVMDGTGPLPAGPTTLNVSTVTGTIAVGMSVTDGGASLTSQPLLITAGSGTKWTVLGNYYPSISADATMVGTLSKVIPGEYIRNAAMLTPVKVVAFQPGACTTVTTAAILNGGLGCYSLSNTTNGTVGSAGTPSTFVGTTITDGGVPAPGIALTIRDQGPGVTFPVTNYGAGTGLVALSGTFDAPTLGGTPASIQVLVSNTANGPPLSGCTPCNWGTLTGTIGSGVWSGSISGIPAGGQYSISVRASNGTAYATLPSTIRVGIVMPVTGEGSVVGLVGSQLGGSWQSYYSGLWNQTGLNTEFRVGQSGSTAYLVTPLANDFLPTQTTAAAGDAFGPNGVLTGASLPEGMGAFEQTISNAFGGWPVAYIAEDRDGTSMIEWTTGNVIQTETIDVGDGTKKVWCSQASLCPGTSGGTVGRDGFLGFNMASLTGAWFQGSVLGNSPTGLSTLTIGTYNGGAIEPGMILSGAGISGSPKVLYCVTCPGVTNPTGQAPNGGAPQGSTWVLDMNLGTVSSENMRLDPTPALIPFGLSSTPYPTFNYQGAGGNAGACCQIGSGYGAYLIKAGTFQITDTDPTTHVATVVCQDTQTFAYNNTGGNCTTVGTLDPVSSSFINYQTGDYQITFTSAPGNQHVLTAQWMTVAAPESVNSAQLSRPQGQDFVGDGTSSSGAISNIEAKAPGGVSGRVYGGCSSDTTGGLLEGNGLVSAYQGYQFGGPGYSQQLAYLYGTKLPNMIPGSSGSTPIIMQPYGRSEGALAFNYGAIQQGAQLCPQLAMDMTTKSTFAGSITSNVLTLSADAVGPMWEGEVIGGGALVGTSGSTATGVYITGLHAGSPAGWGKNTSTYDVSGMSVYNAANGGSSGTASGPFFNDVFYTPGTGIYGGTLNDLLVQANSTGALTGAASHESNGPTGGPRHGRRLAAMSYQGYLNPNVPNDPTVDRVKADATGCDTGALAAPCFDIGTSNAAHDAFPASHSATWSTGGHVFTVTGGLAAHDRPFVVGQAVTCASCNTGLVITSVSLPPSQDTSHANAGQVGNTFTFTVANGSAQAIGGSGSGTVTAGCSGTSGIGSNCIDIAFSINASGTFGTAKALATCGENNLNGNAPPFSIPNGKCQDNGIGTLVRTFRIGAQQQMSNLAAGSYFDDGVDLIGGNFTQTGAFTCNIVSALVVQCVKAPVITGLSASVGQWTSGATYVSYGDQAIVTGRQGSLLGPVGGQSLPINNPGTGYGNQTIQGSCTLISGGWNPNFDIKTSGGAIIGVYPASTGSTGGTHQAAGLGLNSSCSITPTGGSGASIPNIPLGDLEGKATVGNFNTDTNMTGLFLYGNEGFPGNPLNVFYTNGRGGYFEPGDAVQPFGMFQGLRVSG